MKQALTLLLCAIGSLCGAQTDDIYGIEPKKQKEKPPSITLDKFEPRPTEIQLKIDERGYSLSLDTVVHLPYSKQQLITGLTTWMIDQSMIKDYEIFNPTEGILVLEYAFDCSGSIGRFSGMIYNTWFITVTDGKMRIQIRKLYTQDNQTKKYERVNIYDTFIVSKINEECSVQFTNIINTCSNIKEW